MKPSFISTLQDIREGDVLLEATESLAELVGAVKATGSPQTSAAASKGARRRRTTAGGRQGGQTPPLPAAVSVHVPPAPSATRGEQLAAFSMAVSQLDSTLTTVDHKLVVEILHKNDGKALTHEAAQAAMVSLLEHADDLKAAFDEGGTAEESEVRDGLVHVARAAFALLRTYDAQQQVVEARNLHQGEASL